MNSLNTNISVIAGLAHEANRIFCESHGDNSQPLWADAPDWQKASAVDGVKHLIVFPYTSAKQSHENWTKHKQNDGWIYGDKKDEKQKTHPCLKRYELLSIEQQTKDHIFRSVVLGFLTTFYEDDKRKELADSILLEGLE